MPRDSSNNNTPEDVSDTEASTAPGKQPLEEALRERVNAIGNATERRTVAGLARELSKLPAESARVAIETSALLTSVSLRASKEFLQAAPAAARVLDADELRLWADIGRRLTMMDTESGAAFYAAGVSGLAEMPKRARLLLFQICARQLALSSSIATATFHSAPRLAQQVAKADLLCSIFEVALEITRHSAKHSADFLLATPHAVVCFARFGTEQTDVEHSAVRLVAAFAVRAGGVAADVWAALPTALHNLPAHDALKLFRATNGFLERGGTAALHVLNAGGEVLRTVPEAFDDWIDLLRRIAEHGGAGLVGLTRTGPAVFHALRTKGTAASSANKHAELSRRVITAVRDVLAKYADAEAAINCLRSAPQAFQQGISIEQFESWARRENSGSPTEARSGDTARSRRSYYALETRQSHEALRRGSSANSGDTQGEVGLRFDEVAHTLRLYVEALTGRSLEIKSLAHASAEARISDGRTIYLPPSVTEFVENTVNFRLYKVLAAHAAGQVEFGTHERATIDLQTAYTAIHEIYTAENVDARDAFSLSGYIAEVTQGEAALSPQEEARRSAATRPTLPPGADYQAVLQLFPHVALATRIFGMLENARINNRLRAVYRGLRRDLDLVREHLRQSRPPIERLPITLVPFELLFQITLCGGASTNARGSYGQIVSELESIVADYLFAPTRTVADTLIATSRVYSLFQSVVPSTAEQQSAGAEESGAEEAANKGQADEEAREMGAARTKAENEAPPQQSPSKNQPDARELFGAWANAETHDGSDDAQFSGPERWWSSPPHYAPDQQVGPGETAYFYDEWDRELLDTRVGWCRVIEKPVPESSDCSFVQQTRARYGGLISTIKRQFQMMKPENLKRVPNQLDGDDFDLTRVIDYVIDRRAEGQASERLYTRRLRREREVAVSFLLDQSSSTARTIGRHPLQPYTHPGRRIIEIEKEGLVLMSEALEAVGDLYAIYGFTSEGRRNVKFYVVKDFAERYSETIERRIGGITYEHNTRFGAAIRHAATRLAAQQARARLLIVLSDGRPYDHDYGDARYAREDTREALREARLAGIKPFCITIDQDSETELRDIYGEVGYTIIDDVLSLPERLPGIYRKLTT